MSVMFLSVGELAQLGLKELQQRHPDLIFSTEPYFRYDEDSMSVMPIGLLFNVRDRRFETDEEYYAYHRFKDALRTLIDPNLPEEKILTLFFEVNRKPETD